MKTHLRTRAFLLCFLPFAILMTTSFWMIQRFVQATVREGLHTSLRQSQLAIANIHAKGDLRNSRFLRIAGENTALKAGLELLRQNPRSSDARRTVEDQLRELGEHMGFDFMLVSAPGGNPLAGVARQGSQLVPLNLSNLDPDRSGFLLLHGRTFQVASVPVDVNNENIGSLTVGEFFEFSDLSTQVVLMHHGLVVESNLGDVSSRELETALAPCRPQSECDLHLNGTNWIALPMETYGNGYTLLSLDNVDQATHPIQAKLHKLFLQLAFAGVLIAVLCSLGSSTSIVNPIATVVSHLRNAVKTGRLGEIESQRSSIVEIQELAQIYNEAAISVHAAGQRLESAYLEFVGSLANALDARDQYTAGHSRRVSELSCVLATALQLPLHDVERIRIGALLHDIGKIGVSDSVLQKPGRLTEEEFDLVKQHPVIGRRILEGVHGFAEYLNAVELHHENWNGTGYPHGQRETETPIDARIIHVADAYDAMTTDRSYRQGMAHEKALSILVDNAGLQFDPEIVATFLMLPRRILTAHPVLKNTPECVEEILVG
ncbi:MAG TPA: HD domain-containing phosphohydrolase [Terracidiphilus sp.]|nr:HD domain-containing phosphohydrolase [Terracidiphilus sp.]